MSIISRKIDGMPVEQRRKDGYINASTICSARQRETGVRRETKEWLIGRQTQKLLESVSLTTGIPQDDLFDIKCGRYGGTWIHPDLLPELLRWLNQSGYEKTEEQVQGQLFLEVCGKREVLTLAGKIDILYNTQLIEVKRMKRWIHGVGQLVVYGAYYPSHQKRLHLFGETQEDMLDLIKSHCKRQKIVVTWEA